MSLNAATFAQLHQLMKKGGGEPPVPVGGTVYFAPHLPGVIEVGSVKYLRSGLVEVDTGNLPDVIWPIGPVSDDVFIGEESGLDIGVNISIKGIAFNGQYGVAAGRVTSPSNQILILRSTDHGATWARVGPTGDKEAFDVQYANGTFLIATENGIYRSIDNGETWSLRTAMGGLKCASLAYHNGIWVVCGGTSASTTTNKVNYSSNDGLGWTSITLPSAVNYSLLAVGWEPEYEIFIAGDEVGRTIYSTDGINWLLGNLATSFAIRGLIDTPFGLINPELRRLDIGTYRFSQPLPAGTFGDGISTSAGSPINVNNNCGSKFGAVYSDMLIAAASGATPCSAISLDTSRPYVGLVPALSSLATPTTTPDSVYFCAAINAQNELFLGGIRRIKRAVGVQKFSSVTSLTTNDNGVLYIRVK